MSEKYQANSFADKIDQVRRHFEIQNGYRQPKPNPNESSSSSDTDYPDLSASFEEILRHRRTQQPHSMINGDDHNECDPSTASQLSDAVHQMMASCTVSSDRRRYVDETQLDEVDEPSLFERLSPCKRVGLLRPSTVLEDSTEGQYEDSADGSTLSESGSERNSLRQNEFRSQTSFESTESRTPNEESTANADYTRDSLCNTRGQSTANRYDRDSLECNRKPGMDDTLEVVEYDPNAPTYALKPVEKHRSADVIELDDSSSENSYHTAQTNARRSTNAALDSPLDQSIASVGNPNTPSLPKLCSFYAPDDLIKSIKSEQVSAGLTKSVIVLDDSDDDVDAMSAGDSMNSECSEVSGTSAATGQSASTASMPDHTNHADSVMDDSVFMTEAIPDEFNDTIERMDYLMALGRRIKEKERGQSNSSERSLDSLQMPAESVQPSIARNPIVQKSTGSQSVFRTPQNAVSANTTPKTEPTIRHPTAVMPARCNPSGVNRRLIHTPVERNSPILRTNSATNSPSNGRFKKPVSIQSASLVKKTPTSATSLSSRIPKLHSGTKAAFQHVMSPIGAYIGKTAPNPMQKNIVFKKDIMDTSTFMRANAQKELDFTLLPESSGAENVPPQAAALPKKAYVRPEHVQIVDKRNQVIPGGAKVQKLIGVTPLVISHQGHSNIVGTTSAGRQRAPEFDVDDSFHNMSLNIADVSIQAVHNARLL